MLRGAGAGLGAAALAPVFGLGDRPAGAARARLTARAAGQPGHGLRPGLEVRPGQPFGTATPFGAFAYAQAPGFDDSSWRSLSVPHDWSIELQPQSVGGVSGGTGYLQGGLGWYRKTFTLPPSMAGKKLAVDFDGVYMDSYVYLNGTLLGNHPYGYTGFAYDISSLAYTDGVTPNVLAVVVQNKLPSSRWYSGSGIYRSVHLTVTDPIHVARLGTFVTTPTVESTIGSGYAVVHVKTDVQNETAAGATADIVQTIRTPTAPSSPPVPMPASRSPSGPRRTTSTSRSTTRRSGP